MRRRSWLLTGLALAALCCKAPPPPPPQNLILVTVDTLRADHLGYAGWSAARTPNIDALAARGLRFDNAITPFPRTTPALASLLTGLGPLQHGSREVGQPIVKGTTLATHLEAAGFLTLGVSANGAAGPPQGLAAGFADFVDASELPRGRARVVTKSTLDLLDAHRDDARRLFLWVHYIDPHFPYNPPREWTDQPEAPLCREVQARSSGNRTETAHVVSNLGGRSEAARQDCVALYDAEIAYLDHAVGLLLEGLESRGVLADSLVVLTSDHGENLGEESLYFQHGPSLHQASMRVPLIVAAPQTEPRDVEGLIALQDLQPTLLGWLGVPGGEAVEGHDYSPALRRGDELATRRRVTIAESGSALLVESFRYLSSGRSRNRNCTNGDRYSLCGDDDDLRLYDHVADPDLQHDLQDGPPGVRARLLEQRRRWPPEAARQRGLYAGSYKLVARPRADGSYAVSLYDVANDPAQGDDVAQQHPELTERLTAMLEEQFAGHGSDPLTDLSESELETLRALGYIN